VGRSPLIQKCSGPSEAEIISRPDSSAGKNLTTKPTLMGQTLDQVNDLQSFLQVEAWLAELVATKPYFSNIESLPHQTVQKNVFSNEIATKHRIREFRSSFLIELFDYLGFDQSQLPCRLGVLPAVSVSRYTLALDRYHCIYSDRFSTSNRTGTDQLYGCHSFSSVLAMAIAL
jgi:hypothetical protein